ncbi:MAG: AbrB/MazE/SpoVT family DNA-binding domain-containing protein [Acidobacteriia bacterium]|nr:AbrB/MazE/SpoVT family DNA-binding domain-containing protein [Terriglobia bacterium]
MGILRKVTLDRAGRVVLPKTLRDELHLSPGDTLDLTVKGDEVTWWPRRGATSLQKERGVRVFRIGEPLTAGETEETIRNIPAQRHGTMPGIASEGVDTPVLVATFCADHEHHPPSIDLFLRYGKEEACRGAHSLAEVYATRDFGQASRQRQRSSAISGRG